MAPTPPDRQFILELVIKSSHPALLEGLDVWLQMGLLSDEAVRQVCQDQLVCPVQQPAIARATEVAPEDFLPSAELSSVPVRAPGRLAQVMQSFMAEISVVWLLFLGVFLVVVSSGVLAASQWRNVSSLGQYLILLTYTLAFWFAGVFTGRRANLRLTSRMLQIATLLIIPVNFWMMDGFHLWQAPAGVGVAAIAALVLSGATGSLLKTSPGRRMVSVTAIALSWLHWGWGIAGIPLIATYLGTIGATLVLVVQDLKQSESRHLAMSPISPSSGVEAANSDPARASEAQLPDSAAISEIQGSTSDASPSSSPLSLGFIAVAVGALLLVFRAIFIKQIPVPDLGLAVGICGWLLCWLSRQNRARIAWTWAGAGLLLLSWAVTVGTTPPWQAIAISGLALWLCVNYLQRTAQGQYLSAGFLIGLQASWLIWRVLPATVQQGLIDAGIRLAGQTSMPFALIGLWLFPYVILTVVLAVRLHSWNSTLARQAEILGLALGIVLASVSFGNDGVRWINLTLSALTLIVVARQRTQPEVSLIYLTHAVTLGAIASGIQYFLPNLTPLTWAGILLAATAIEWGFAGLVISAPTDSPQLTWQKSTWHYGLALAVLSYAPLSELSYPNRFWGGLWLLVPLLLTWLGSRRHFLQWKTAAWLSVFALFLAQWLLLDSINTMLVGFGVATALMLQNTRVLRRLFVALVTVGFAVGFVLLLAWKVFGEVTYPWFLVLLAIAPLLLWVWRSRLLHSLDLGTLYKKATDGWAIALTIFTLLLLTLTNLAVYLEWTSTHWQFILAPALLLLATSYRLWQSLLRGGLYLPAWSVELVMTSLIAQTGRSLDAVGIGNLSLGLASQLLGDWWAHRNITALRGTEELDPSPLRTPYPAALHIIPLLYALLGVVLMHRTFTATTGLCTLAAALVGMGVGRRHISLKPLTIFALLSASFGTYELLVYQLSQAKGGYLSDGLLLLAALGLGLAIALRLLKSWIAAYLRLTPLELLAIAHCHWFLGNAFLLLALFNPLVATGEWLWLGISAIATIYALSLGRTALSLPLSPSLWLYLGILQFFITFAYFLHLILPEPFLLTWAGAIAAITSTALYLSPWQRWGWTPQPWRRSAAILPGVVTLLTASQISLQGLLIVAAFYAWLAKNERQPRLSYLSVGLADWAILRYLYQQGSTEPLWQVGLFSASLLYITQVDPALRSPTEREKRHWLRCLASGLICLTAFYQAEVGIANVLPVWVGILSVGLAFGFILAGIWLRIRAFLYVGTLVFILQILRQLWRFIGDYSLLLWALGIALGLLLIWIAATFEARRSQVASLVNYWATELDSWD